MSSANLTRSECRARGAVVEASSYDVHLDLSAARDHDRADFPVTVRIRFTSTQPETWLDFIGAGIDGVQVNDQQIDVSWDGARLALTGLRTDGSPNIVQVQARANYSRSGQGLHRFFDPADEQTYLYSHAAPADARRIFPVFEQPDLKASFVLSVTAPREWLVTANQPDVHTEDVESEAGRAMKTWSFAPSPPMSSYLVAVAAGPWHRVEDAWSMDMQGQQIEVPLGILCRQSLAEHLDADDIFTITKQGLTHYHELFDYPYPWTKYDQVFVPEYNLGAMENPGCVTFNEKFIFRSVPTRAQYQSRANVILHEMAHMWFGDLVTARWWDDIWLNESFAEYMGTAVSADATQFTDAWIPFADQRKSWAYTADQLPSTHPIVADIVDLEAADQNFDGITYAKGAAVLKQLVYWVGPDAFHEGVRRYFRRHAFGNATLADLLAELESASGRDLGSWAQAWLETSGPSVLRAEWVPGEGETRTLRVSQQVDEQHPLRPHLLAVGRYELTDGKLVRVERAEVELAGEHADVEFAPAGADEVVLVNDDDLTYARVLLDETSTKVALNHLSALPDTMARALLWSTLWEAVRDAELSAVAFLRAVLDHGGAEVDSAVLSAQTARAARAVERFLPADMRQAAREDWFTGARARAEAAEPGSDAQRIWARAAITAGGVVQMAAPWLFAQLDGGTESSELEVPRDEAEVDTEPVGPVEGLVMDHELRWLTLQSLSGLGQVAEGDLAAELERDKTASGAVAHLRAHTSQPLAEIKAHTWSRLHTAGEWTNAQVDAAIAGLTHPEPERMIDYFCGRYFDSLEQVWQDFPMELSQRLVRGLFPGAQDLTEDGPDAHPIVATVESWLAEHEDAPAALRRILIDELDELRRSLRAQGKASA
ncbi:aminopeptidase N [Enemella sp. A6]|uniref:aminopeptidase N n=1 Tax=Enemella sp. A6 TaxID=3440152 RepID=UPI003EBC1775